MFRIRPVIISGWIAATTWGAPAMASDTSETITTPGGLTITLPVAAQLTQKPLEKGVVATTWTANPAEFSASVTAYTLPTAKLKQATAKSLIAQAQSRQRESQPSRTKVRNSHVFSLDGGAEAWRWSLQGHGTQAHTLTIISPTPDGMEVASVRTHHSYRSDAGEVGTQAVLDSVTLNGVPVRVPKSE